MKKLDSKQHKETPEEELKRLRKIVKQLEFKEVKNSNSIKGLRKELKKKDVQNITMTNEHPAFLPHQFSDLDSLFSSLSFPLLFYLVGCPVLCS